MLPCAWTEAASRTTTERTTSRTSLHPSSAQQLKPSFPQAVYFTYPSRLVLEILAIFKKYASYLNTLLEKFGELGRTVGFRLSF